jgi:hypothetical protein
LTIAVLFVVAAGIAETGAISLLSGTRHRWTGRQDEGFVMRRGGSVPALASLADTLGLPGRGAVIEWVLGKTNSIFVAQLRLMLPLSFLSAFTNNTPLTAIMIPGSLRPCVRMCVCACVPCSLANKA